ncbi:MAG: LysR family transcriptional regulator [Zetaproteobacteria bacterium]|nr:LysR family transcriptional regulator [Zetaproteobacteria bacterium]
MTLDQLRAFCAVVEKGGFHAAAEGLFRSQSAVSIAIKNLESEIQCELFDRSNYRPDLNAAGRILYDKAKGILAKAEDFVSAAAHFSQGGETEISIALGAITPVEQVIEVVQSVSAQAPATRMTLQIENMGGTLERLFDKDVDFAIAERFAPVPNTESVRLTSTTMVAVIAPSFVLAACFPEIKVKDLELCVQVVVRDTSRHRPKQSAGLIEGAQQWLVNDFDMKKRVILSGSGWGRMPYHRVAEELADGRLLALSGAGLEPVELDIYLFRRLNETMGPVGDSLWNALQEVAYVQNK